MLLTCTIFLRYSSIVTGLSPNRMHSKHRTWAIHYLVDLSIRPASCDRLPAHNRLYYRLHTCLQYQRAKSSSLKKRRNYLILSKSKHMGCVKQYWHVIVETWCQYLNGVMYVIRNKKQKCLKISPTQLNKIYYLKYL